MSRRGKAIDLSTDQRPSCSTELARIELAGGFVEDGYINGHLGVARAFGDFHIEGLKGDPDGGTPGPLIVEPEVERWSLTAEDEFLVIACDGLWDVFSSQNAVDFARQALRRHNDAAAAARELALEALRRDSADNVSVIVVCFSDAPPPDKVQEKRTAPRASFTRAISVEGLSELQKALKSDDEAAIVAAQKTPTLQRVNSINPQRRPSINGNGSGGRLRGSLSEDFMGALDSLDMGGGNSSSGEAIDNLSPLAEECSPGAEE
jgi:protein phosphatase 2C family protein 2/3